MKQTLSIIFLCSLSCIYSQEKIRSCFVSNEVPKIITIEKTKKDNNYLYVDNFQTNITSLYSINEKTNKIGSSESFDNIITESLYRFDENFPLISESITTKNLNLQQNKISFHSTKKSEYSYTENKVFCKVTYKDFLPSKNGDKYQDLDLEEKKEKNTVHLSFNALLFYCENYKFWKKSYINTYIGSPGGIVLGEVFINNMGVATIEQFSNKVPCRKFIICSDQISLDETEQDILTENYVAIYVDNNNNTIRVEMKTDLTDDFKDKTITFDLIPERTCSLEHTKEEIEKFTMSK